MNGKIKRVKRKVLKRLIKNSKQEKVLKKLGRKRDLKCQLVLMKSYLILQIAAVMMNHVTLNVHTAAEGFQKTREEKNGLNVKAVSSGVMRIVEK